jgi:hypothetical protein
VVNMVVEKVISEYKDVDGKVLWVLNYKRIACSSV